MLHYASHRGPDGVCIVHAQYTKGDARLCKPFAMSDRPAESFRLLSIQLSRESALCSHSGWSSASWLTLCDILSQWIPFIRLWGFVCAAGICNRVKTAWWLLAMIWASKCLQASCICVCSRAGKDLLTASISCTVTGVWFCWHRVSLVMEIIRNFCNCVSAVHGALQAQSLAWYLYTCRQLWMQCYL